MNTLTAERINFIELLNDAFLSHTGHGAYAYISTVESLDLFTQFQEQSKPAKQFIKSVVKTFL